MTEQAVQKLRLSSPGDLVEAVPYLLGYHPSDSMVALALRGSRRRVVFTMRLDLPQPGEGDIATPLAQSVGDYLAHAKADQAVLVVYGDTGDVLDGLPHSGFIEAATRALVRRRIAVIEALYVGAGRWWSYTCDLPTCCPSEGTPITTDGCSTVAATATYAGMVALPNREAVEKILEPEGFLAGAGMAQALARADEALTAQVIDRRSIEVLRAETRALLTDAVDSEPVLSDDAAARLIVGIEDIVVRDECCEWAGTERARPAQRLWVQLARRAAPGYDIVPLALVGWFAWRDGDSTLARIAVDRCLRSDPGYSLARLLQEALDFAVNPAALSTKLPAKRTRSRKRRR